MRTLIGDHHLCIRHTPDILDTIHITFFTLYKENIRHNESRLNKIRSQQIVVIYFLFYDSESLLSSVNIGLYI